MLLGLRAQLREDTGLSLAEAVVGAQIVLQTNFSKMTNLQLTPLSKIFPQLCIFLLLLCLGTILAPTCPESCQPSCSPPPSSGSIGAAWFHPFSRSTTAPTRSCSAAPTPSPSELGRGTRWLPSIAAADCRARPQAVLPQPSGSRFQTRGLFTLLFSGAATRRFRNRFPTRRGGFCMPGTAGAFAASTDMVPVSSMGTTPEVGPLTSSSPSRGQSSGGALWRAGYIPVTV
jgi:hypothetical protein